jgi:general secretion pathway protein I
MAATLSLTAVKRRMTGFTMLEVLVALTIVAVALAASLRAAGSLTINSTELQQRLLASWSADNALAQLRLERIWLAPGITQFDCPQGNTDFVCTRTVSPTPNPGFRRIDVVVKRPGREEELAHLITVITNEPPAP